MGRKNKTIQTKDIYFLKKTFELAKKSEGFTSPNPLVGAIIVKKGKIIAKGYHKRAGLPHAEIEAIRKAKENLKNSTLYVNLEPCFHFGRTPPCVDEIIKSGIKKVVIAIKDPNPLVNGKSIKKLKSAGIKVVIVKQLGKEAKKLNEVFFKNMRKRLPFIAVKIAQSLDGKIATKTGQSKWITTEKSRKFVKVLRDKYDSILVGINTVLKDNPHLDGFKKRPFKIVIDPNLKIPLNSFLVKKRASKLIIFTDERNKNNPKIKSFPSFIKLFFLKSKKGYFILKKILKILFNLQIMSVLIEGGSETLGRFFDEKLIDKVYFFISPKIIGGKDALTSVGGKGMDNLKKVPFLKDLEIKRIGKDILILGYPIYEK
ncbi:MAG: bifunctional diaminohydroxyphosphoribosylaminopyrimidine deaminase/5-amino-6-(5-phosphoribosylamino)uracil reductase RibD [Candidatus Aenigmatarchaeota archaeon]